MELKVNMIICEEVPAEFNVTFSGQTKTIDGTDKSAVFTFEESGTYDIEFSQQVIDESFSFSQKIMYLLFLPLTGILSLLMLYDESPWHIRKKIHPYLITQKILLTVDSDINLTVRYVPSVFNEKTGYWSKPVLIFSECDIADEPVIIKNDKAFDNCYLEFKRSFSSAFFVIALFFSILGIIALCKIDLVAFAIFISFAAILSGICIITIIAVKNNIKNAKKIFITEKAEVPEVTEFSD